MFVWLYTDHGNESVEEDDASVVFSDSSDEPVVTKRNLPRRRVDDSEEISRYEASFARFEKQEPKLSSFIQSMIVCIDVIELQLYNRELKIENDILEIINIIFDQFSNTLLEQIYLPEALMEFCKTHNIYTIDTYREKCARNVIAVTYKNHLWGMLFIRWPMSISSDENNNENSNDQMLNFPREFVNTNGCETQICGRARLFHPMNLTNVHIEKQGGYKIIPQVNPNYIHATTVDCAFNEKFHHKVGFVWHHLKTFFGGDLSHCNNLSGICGTATNMCLICTVTQEQNRECPSPLNRTWTTRDYTNAAYCENGNILLAKQKLNENVSKDDLKGYTNNALYDVPPMFISLAVFHMFEGIMARIFYPFIGYVNRNEPENNQNSNNKQNRKNNNNLNEHNLNSNVNDNLQMLMQDMMNKQDALQECRAVQNLVEREGLEQTKSYCLFVNNLNNIERECKEATKKVQDALSKRGNTNGRKLSALLMKYNIREFNPVSHTMQGRSARNFLKNWTKMKKFLNDDPTLKSLYTGVMIRFEFIHNTILKKNFKPYSDELLKKVKKAIIEFDSLYKKFLIKISSDIDYKKFGFKIHYLYHCWEWCKFFRFSPAWIDDQRCEAFNLRLKRYWSIFASAMNEINLLKMINTMVRKTTTIQAKGATKMINQTNKLLVHYHSKYYKKNFANKPIISSDTRYRRFANYSSVGK